MRKIVINGGKPLKGEVAISGAKNSVVALIPATILSDDVVTLDGVPDISDVDSLIEIMEIMGAKVKREGDTLEIDPRGVKNQPMPYGKINSLRASYYFYGSLLSRFGEATVGLPGGCDLGPRPIDLHLKAFEAMGASISYEGEAMRLSTEGEPIHGAHIYMDTVSVGATINTMLAATKAKGRTTIENAAREPEIIDVATLLNNMGAHIRGAGTDIITIEGVDYLHGTRHQVIPDRIEAGTYMMIGTLLGNNLKIDGIIPEHLTSVISKLKEAGASLNVKDNHVIINKVDKLEPVNIKTLVYPGFVTDLGQPMSTLLTQCEGTSIFEETIYENRMRHIKYLNKMGANIDLDGKVAMIHGKTCLHGETVEATDLRAGAAMLLAGMIAKGTTTITNIEHILRGYENIVTKLTTVGANIKIIDE